MDNSLSDSQEDNQEYDQDSERAHLLNEYDDHAHEENISDSVSISINTSKYLKRKDIMSMSKKDDDYKGKKSVWTFTKKDQKPFSKFKFFVVKTFRFQF